jgi:membrane protein YfhO
MARSIPARRRTAACLVGLALLPFALFWRVTVFQRVFAEGDLYSYNYPLLLTMARQWAAGELPLWNPYIFGGTPLHANMQAGAFYPPNVLLLVLPAWRAYQYTILLHYSLAGLFTFVFLRALSLSRTAALMGSVVFMLGGFAMGTLGHVSTLRAYPWLPLILFALEKWTRTLDRRYVALGGAAIGLMLLAGHPQIPLYSLLVGVAYACGRLFSARHPRARLAAGYAANLALGAGLAAIQILPSLPLAAEEYLRPGDRGYEYFVTFSLSPALLANLVFPRILPANEAELAVYVGISTLVLALVACLRPSGNEWHRNFFVIVAVAALVLAFGEWTLLAPLLFRVPLYNLFTAPARNLFEVHFALAVLAALGVEAIRDPEAGAHRRKAVLVFVLLTCLGMTLMGLVRDFGPALEPRLVTLASVGWAHPVVGERLPVILASLGLVFAFPTSRRWRTAGSAGLLALAVADLFSYARGIYRLDSPAVYLRVPAVVSFLRQTEAGRILVLRQPRHGGEQAAAMLSPDTNAVHAVESINGFDSMMLRQVDAASRHVMPTHGLIVDPAGHEDPQFRRFMDLLNTRHVLTPRDPPLELSPPRYRSVYEDGLVRVFENADALPRAFVVPLVRAVTHQEALDVLASGRLDGVPFDPHRLAVVETDEPRARSAIIAEPAATGEAHVREMRAGRVRIATDSSSGGLLVHSASYSKGWRAVVDGSPVPLYRTDGLLQGVPIPKGRHEVLLEYRPRSFDVGAAVSLVSLALIGIIVARRRVTAVPPPGPGPDR